MKVYSNLKAEVARKNLKMAEVAEAIGRTASTFSQKMNGVQGFTLKEAFDIKHFLNTKLSIDELFQQFDVVDGDE